jgi:CubicO group peptidase (beta-lactamase class C family)
VFPERAGAHSLAQGTHIARPTGAVLLPETLHESLPRTLAAIQKGIELGWHPGAQVCVWLDGETVADDADGYAADRVPMTRESVNLWLSAGKPVGAIAIGILKDRGLIDLDKPVAGYWPEFGQNGKEAITTRHILTHTGGFRTAEGAEAAPALEDAVRAVATARIERDWEPGKKGGYHATAGWRVLSELVRLLSGEPYEDFTREEIFEPLGMDSSTFSLDGVAASHLGGLYSPMHTTRGAHAEPDPHYGPEVMGAYVRPGGGLRSKAADMVRMYRMLLDLGGLDGAKILEPSTAAAITTPQRVGMHDQTFGHVMDWGFGVMFDNKVHNPAAPYGFGAHASPRTFGHGGKESSTAFADPENDLAVAVVFNGMPGELKHDRRLRMVTEAVYEDLGLA